MFASFQAVITVYDDCSTGWRIMITTKRRTMDDVPTDFCETRRTTGYRYSNREKKKHIFFTFFRMMNNAYVSRRSIASIIYFFACLWKFKSKIKKKKKNRSTYSRRERVSAVCYVKNFRLERHERAPVIMLWWRVNTYTRGGDWGE